MQTPTQKQMNEFLEKASQDDLRIILKDTKDKMISNKAKTYLKVDIRKYLIDK